VWRGQHLAFEVPYLHLLVEFLCIESLVNLKMLKGVEVEVACQTSLLSLLLIKLPKVSHHWEALKSELGVSIVLFDQAVAVVDHIEALLKHEVVKMHGEYDPVSLHCLVESYEKVRLTHHQKGAHVISLLSV